MTRLLVRAAVAAVLAFTAASAVSPVAAGALEGEPLWAAYKARYMKASGRVVDNMNGNVSHSEGQGFAMVLAVAAKDASAFEKLWTFTRERLQVRRDRLLAWRWTPRGLSRVPDRNNAADGDLLVAWALLEAAEKGFGTHYADEGRAILADLRRLTRRDRTFGIIMKPAAVGFSASDRRGREVVNLSYWVMPALERLTVLTGDRRWRTLAENGPRLIEIASRNRARLPGDWSALDRRKGRILPAPGFDKRFAYNAIRVPLYLAWSGGEHGTQLAAMRTAWAKASKGRAPAMVSLTSGRAKGRFTQPGYRAVSALLDCAVEGTRFPRALRRRVDRQYYAASLQLLSVLAVKERHPSCW